MNGYELGSAQAAILASMLVEPSCVPSITAEMDEQDFTTGTSRILFRAIKRLHEGGTAVDAVTLAEELENTGDLTRIGGMSYLSELLTQAITPSNVGAYVAGVRQARQRRELISGLSKAITAAEDGDASCIELAQAAVDAASSIGASAYGSVGDYVDEAVAAIGETTTGVLTRFPDLDYTIDGMHGGDLLVLGARPSMGKTAFAMNVAANVTLHGGVVQVFSLEMSRTQLLQRMVFSLSKATRYDVVRGDAQATARMADAAQRIRRMRMRIDDRGCLSCGQIKSQCYQTRQREGRLDLVVIDYIGLMRTNQRRGGTREQEVAELSRSLKNMARELGCTVLLLSQLNRGLESRNNKEPVLSDLRESGAIEQDADVVLFLHRASVYDESEPKNDASLIVAKNRNGMTGYVKLNWDGEHFLFTSAALPEIQVDSAVFGEEGDAV